MKNISDDPLFCPLAVIIDSIFPTNLRMEVVGLKMFEYYSNLFCFVRFPPFPSLLFKL